MNFIELHDFVTRNSSCFRISSWVTRDEVRVGWQRLLEALCGGEKPAMNATVEKALL